MHVTAERPSLRVAGLLVALLLAAGAVAAVVLDPVAVKDSAALAGLTICGYAPAAGPAGTVSSLDAPRYGAVGDDLSTTLFVQPTTGGSAPWVADAGFDVLLVRAGRVVGGATTRDPTGGEQLRGHFSLDQAAVLDERVRLFGCPTISADGKPGSRAVPPPGDYELVAVAVDNGAQVVSRPAAFDVTPAAIAGPGGTSLKVWGVPHPKYTPDPDLEAVLVPLSQPVAGSLLQLEVKIAPHSGTRRIETGQPRVVEIVYDGYIVGRSEMGIAGTGVIAKHVDMAHPLVVPNLPALLSRCSDGPVDTLDPDAHRRPLPPGQYELRVDDNETPGITPLAITVTA